MEQLPYSTLVPGEVALCLAMLSLLYVITYYKLNVCLISPFEACACRDYIFYLICIDNYLRDYTESTINIIRVLKVICVNSLSKISYNVHILINFTDRLIFL